jgi:hypothetical protein
MSDETFFDQTYNELVQKKDIDKVRWLDQIEKRIPPTFRKRIQANDKTVLHELLVPSWVKWDLLYSWATEKAVPKEKNNCVLCQQTRENGIHFHGRFVCETCFKTIRSMGTEREQE